ncbi:RHS repeat domain-containing protein [Chitinophaga arvensicola]|uniref:YD repeat-containing protein n=1 Tax=Chitinophaga arvensicola TaxID=29529 RepID=A0A1I0QPP7_9BACT|nr:RHS repeat domain-containing protein [Chitinophaga arvensicola]SEW29267.1 YD repeat-containing protein [Chitinophaga arvensicola]
MSMKNVIYCLIIVIAVSACNTRHKPTASRLSAIALSGEKIPQYTFRYDPQGNLIELVHHKQSNDTNISTFTYDSSHRITGMVYANQQYNATSVQEEARVTAWDDEGNITTIEYFDDKKRLLRTASVRWKDGLPSAMKFSDSTQAISWNYDGDYPIRKDICKDSFPGKKEDSMITLRTIRYEYGDSLNPLLPMVNQLLLSHAIAPVIYLAPSGDLSTAFLHLSPNNPFLIKMTEKEKAICQQRVQHFERSTTLQYAYSFKSGQLYPSGASIHLHSEGFTKLGYDTQFQLEYQYE